MILQYARKKTGTELRAVSFIVIYLLLFQLLVLRIPVKGAGLIAFGVGMVVLGLAFFLEGLFLGIMPLGELCGLWLPRKTNLFVFSIFSLILGFVATLAEPAITVLQTAGGSVKAWEAPLLFGLLNRYSSWLVLAVGAGVGLAVLIGTLRFFHGWPLRPMITFLVPVILGLSAWAHFDPNLRHISALAWDCGGITTGPVTVPIVVSLGIGITRVTRKGGDSGVSGLGVVTLASLIPVAAVLILGICMNTFLPAPSARDEFFSPSREKESTALFEDRDRFLAYALVSQDPKSALENQFGGRGNRFLAFLRETYTDPVLLSARYADPGIFSDWIAAPETRQSLLALFGSGNLRFLESPPAGRQDSFVSPVHKMGLALRAILPLAGILLLILLAVVRKRIPLFDEILLGLGFALIGFFLFSIGMDAGLTNLGSQAGRNLHVAFSSVPFPEKSRVYEDFDLSMVDTAVAEDGSVYEYFMVRERGALRELPFYRENYDERTGDYTYIPERGPLLGSGGRMSGMAVLILFAFFMGLAATLAEPALYALGVTLEEASAGTFHRSFLIRTVAVGVGIGLAFGIVRIVWDIPLLWLLAPPYLLLLVLNRYSTEEFIGIAWDCAGVTTGPVTVPLVIALGLGIGERLTGAESFGILALSSVYPILTVIVSGLFITSSTQRLMRETP